MLNEDKRNRRCSWNKKINLIWIALWEWAIQLNYLLFLCCPKRLINQWRMNWFNGAREVDWIEGLFGFSWTGGWLWPQAAVMADGSCRITSKKNKQTTRNSNQQKTRKWMKWINQTKEMKAMELMKLMEWTSLAAFVWLMSGMEGPRAQAEAKWTQWNQGLMNCVNEAGWPTPQIN